MWRWEFWVFHLSRSQRKAGCLEAWVRLDDLYVPFQITLIVWNQKDAVTVFDLQRCGKHAHCLINVLIYPLITVLQYLAIKVIFEVIFCVSWKCVIIVTEGPLMKNGVYKWNQHRNVGQRRPAVPAQLVCFMNSSPQHLYHLVRRSACLNWDA